MFKAAPTVAALLVIAAATIHPPAAQDRTKEAPAVADRPAMLSFEEADLIKTLHARGRAYHQFIDEPTMSCGIYHLKAGAADGQNPHEEDEVYYVLEGTGRFTTEGATIDVKPGTTIFVRAHATHRFHDIEADLSLLVFFSAAEG